MNYLIFSTSALCLFWITLSASNLFWSTNNYLMLFETGGAPFWLEITGDPLYS